MVYDIRNTGGRRAVNWYRAMPTPANVPDSTNPSDQLTSYATGETVANGAAITEKTPGTGEQGEYKGIGLPSPNYEYDNNKNVISDPTRKFEYNYKNQMRSVSRKSDGDTLVRYMHDAGGREVWNQRRWYVGRHETLDTRFPLDVDLDADNNSTYMVCSDGGIANWEEYDTSWSFEESNWPGLLGFHNNGAENHYFDFQVYVPAYESDTYLGYVAYDIATVHIFSNRVVLTFDRNDYSPSAPGYESESFSWTGWHNIGINVRGVGGGTQVWIDGTDVFTSGMGSPQPDAKAWFASHRAQLAPFSLAVHAFASYRANWEWEIGNVRPVTSVKSSDGITPGAEVNDATWTPELAYATLGSSSTYLARGLSGDLMVQHALPNTRHCNVVWASCEVDDGMSGAALGVIATNTPSESGDPNIHRPAMTSLTTYSPYFTLPTEYGTELGSGATPVTPANYSVGGMNLQVVVNGTGQTFQFDGVNQDVVMQALDAGIGGPVGSTIGRAVESEGVCVCRSSDVSNDSNCLAFIDNSGVGLSDQMGNFGDPEGGMMFIGGIREWLQDCFLGDSKRRLDEIQVALDLAHERLKELQAKVLAVEKEVSELREQYVALAEAELRYTENRLAEEQATLVKAEKLGRKGSIERSRADVKEWTNRKAMKEQAVAQALQRIADPEAMAKSYREDYEALHAKVAELSNMHHEAVRACGDRADSIQSMGEALIEIGAALELIGEVGLMATGVGGAVVAANRARKAGQFTKAGFDAAVKAAKNGCFVSGTRVLTDRGWLPIEDVVIGDLVWSFNTETQVWEWQLVEDTFDRWYSGDVVTLTIGSETIIATGNHPIWVVSGHELGGRPEVEELPTPDSVLTSEGRWVEARFLLTEDVLLLGNGSTVTLAAKSSRFDSLRVFNFEVSGTHTYTVGTNAVLVHNSCQRYTYHDKVRSAPGRDGGRSVITIEKEAGETISKTHRVTVDGKVVHQHQDHIGANGSVRRFPDSWTGNKTIGDPPLEEFRGAKFPGGS